MRAPIVSKQHSSKLKKPRLLDIKAPFDVVVPRVATHMRRVPLSRGLIHEGNNPYTRKSGDTGAALAARWRQLVGHTRGMFVLRDSLFSQQDHPYRVQGGPHALLLPPAWVTVAAEHVRAGHTVKPMNTPALDDDAAWAARSIDEVFGSFPQHKRLFTHATGTGAHAKAARASLRALASATEAMRRAAPWGPDAVARAGAARIAWSDRVYFGAKLRRERVIPIFVENPTDHEIDEGKGMLPRDFRADPALVRRVRNTIYRARLRDGDLAIERYDLSQRSARRRALQLLEDLIPKPERGAVKVGGARQTRVWLWVTGALDPNKKLAGEGPLAHTVRFWKELEGANVDLSRLELFGKPPVALPRGRAAKKQEALREAIRAHRAAGLRHVSVTSYTHTLHTIAKASAPGVATP